MQEEEEGYHRYLISWDSIGVETIFDIDAEKSRKVESALKEVPYRAEDPIQLLEKMRLRARFNTPRNYEIYGIQLPDHLSEDAVREMFDGNFQIMSDLIRRKGVKLY